MPRHLLLLPLFALLAACGEEPPPDISTPAAVEALYEQRCARCHLPHPPEKFPIAVWEQQMAKYGPQAGLTGAAREAVLDHLRARAKDAPPRKADSPVGAPGEK